MLCENVINQKAIELIAKIVLRDYSYHAIDVAKGYVVGYDLEKLSAFEFGGWSIGASSEKGSFRKQKLPKNILDFIKGCGELRIAAEPVRSADSRGIVAAGHYDRQKNEILLFINGEFNGSFSDILSDIKSHRLVPAVEGVYKALNRRYSTFVHELTHAYDDWVSAGKFDQNARSEAANDARRRTWLNPSAQNQETAKSAYYNDPIEINARFTDTVSSLRDRMSTNSWAYIYGAFKREIRGWDNIPADEQKQLAKRLSLIWADTKQPRLRDITGAVWAFEDKLRNSLGVDLQISYDDRRQTDIMITHLLSKPMTVTQQAQVMEQLVKFADIWRRRIVLRDDAIFSAGLLAHYGFIQNKGRNRDYSISAPMYRNSRRAK